MNSLDTDPISTNPAISGKDIKDLSQDISSKLNTIIIDSWTNLPHQAYLEILKSLADTIKNNIFQIGDFSYGKLNANEDTPLSEIAPYYFISFRWIDQAKSFLILLRDSYFQGQKAHILHLENKVNQTSLANLRRASHEVLQAAAEDLKNNLNGMLQPISISPKNLKKQIDHWGLQQDPYPVYRKQMEELVKQIHELSDKNNDLEKIVNELLEIRTELTTAVDTFFNEIKDTQEHAQKAIDFIENHEGKINKVASYLEDFEDKIEPQIDFDIFSKKIDQTLTGMTGRIQVAVATVDGIIQHKDINFKRNVRQWLDAEILPLLSKTWELKENVYNNLKMSFVNIGNRAILLSNENKSEEAVIENPADMSQPLNAFLKKTPTWEKDFIEVKQDIYERLNQAFGFFSVYDNSETFLYVPLPNTIRQINLEQNEWYLTAQNWFKTQFNKVQNLILSVQQNESLSVSEKIVRVIQERTIDPNNHHYSSIFSTKGYIGESFCVGREKEFDHITKLIEQWKLGFRGSVILSGQRFSGKTLFGDIVAKRYFSKNNLRLAPNEIIRLNGRQHTCTYDLKECLEFVRKNAVSEKVMLWIDDLETWTDPDHSLGKNIRDLCKYIDQYSKQNFILVSMCNWSKDHLDKVHDLHKKFQAEINLDHMSSNAIYQAIWMRHGATHKNLVDIEGNEVTSNDFEKLVKKIHRNVEGNIGEALQHWAYSIEKLDEENVRFQPKSNYALPEFTEPDSAILLATLMKQKRTSEYRLNRAFGKPFGGKYKNILQRLQSVGLVTRNKAGELEVNNLLVNDVGKLLEAKQVLSFYHQ